MRKLILALGLIASCFVAILVIGAVVGPQPKPAAAASASLTNPPIQASTENQFSDQVIRQIGRRSPKWQSVMLDRDNSDKSISATIVYKITPDGYDEVEADTKRVARAVLRTLVANGRNPHAEWIFVSVRAQRPETGETGTDVVRLFGSTHYDFNNDQLIFEVAK